MISMKKLALSAALVLNLSAYAAIDAKDGNAQSYIMHDTGEVSSIKTYYNATSLHMFLVPDVFIHHRVNLKEAKGNYFVDEWESIYTVSKDGFVSKVDEVLYRADDIKVWGHSYFVYGDGSLHVIKNDGVIVSYEDAIKDVDLADAKIAGGTFMIMEDGNVIMVDPSGYFLARGFNYKAEQVKSFGHNWFQTSDGLLFTVGFKPMEANGQVQLDNLGNKRYTINLYKYDVKPSIVRKGGNYFFDSNNVLHTISSEGILNMGEKNRQLKVIDMAKNQYRNLPKYYGLNYFIYDDSSVMQIDNAGQMWDLGKPSRRIVRTNMYK